MIGADIVNKLKEDLSKYTGDFNNSLLVNSLVASSGVITANVNSHGLSDGAFIRVVGAKESINIISITRDGNIATVKTEKDHKLIDPSAFTNTNAREKYSDIFIENITPAEYNGKQKVLSVIDGLTFTFIINSTPASPATSYGNVLINDFNSLNGYKQISLIDNNNFSYTTTNLDLAGSAGGEINIFYSNRIDNAVSLDRAIEHYKGSNKGIRMYVVVNDDETYKNGTTSTDIDALVNNSETSRIDLQQNLSIYIFVETQTSTLAGSFSDLARSYRYVLLKSLGNIAFKSFLSDEFYQPLQYLGSGSAGYDTTYYIHEFNFSCRGFISVEDMAEFNIGTPLKRIEGIDDKGLEYNINYR